MRPGLLYAFAVSASLIPSISTDAQVAIKGETVHTMAGPPIRDGVVVIENGKITSVGAAATTRIPAGFRTLTAKVVTPGLIDSRGTVGVSGILNQRQDQDQLERSSPVQPELRGLDAYNPQDRLVEYVREFGITTVHTGHAPGELISGQTVIVKTTGATVDEAVLVETATVAATLGPWAQKSGQDSPGTRAKMIAMLRAEFIKAQEYARNRAKAVERQRKGEAPPPDAEPEPGVDPEKNKKEEALKRGDRNLRLEMLSRVLSRELPLLVTANRAQDIAGALRLAAEFNIRIILDSAAESYLLIDEIKAADGGKGFPVIIHPTMFRASGDMQNMSWDTASKLRNSGIRVAIQSGYESYVPKTRIVLYEAAVAAANGLTFEQALAAITIEAARILGIEARVGSLEVGKDGDVALYDGDPFEYTSHCIGTVINGRVVSEKAK